MDRSSHRGAAALLSTMLLFAACSAGTPATSGPSAGGSGSSATSPGASPSEQASGGAGGAVADLQEVKTAVVQIEATGTFTDPEVGEVVNGAGRGSGFIIDPSGIAVTNNHVVTGAALLKVWVGGETEPRNAKVLGASECSDLAVIDIDGDGYPFLDWYDGEITTGLDIYVAGFPLGDPEYTLTEGIVSKEEANGETQWASVDSVIEHSAATNPGNSGGPVVTADGKVLAVHYAGDPSVRQQFAISEAEALQVLDQLQAGENVNSIGVNGQAVANEDGTVTGVWVASVQSGSPADDAGIAAGDIITSMEGVVLATDGTMADYCDILRSHDASDQLQVQVLRYATEEVLEGELNGDPLAQSFSFRQEEGGNVDETTDVYTEFVKVTDDSGALSMEVPAEWSDVGGVPWVLDDQEIGAQITASPDIDAYLNGWDTPGVFFGATTQLDAVGDVESFLDSNSFANSCTYDGRFDYSDALYTGKYDSYSKCGGTDAAFYVIAAQPESKDVFLVVQIQAQTEADLAVVDQVINTFQVTGDLP
jgi:serine protease Do